MASLYIKDPEVAELAAKAAELQGKTKTQAVKDALLSVVNQLSPPANATEIAADCEQDFVEWLEELHRRYPVPVKAEHDRRVYDWMSDEEDE
jgi:hypothetical protein